MEIKNRICYYFDEPIKIEDFDLDNVLIDEKSSNNILACNSSYKTLIGVKPLRSRFDKNDEFIRACDGTRYLVYLEVENMISFTTGLYIS